MLIACYSRVSTTEQAEHGYSLDEQRTRMESYCKAMSWTVFAHYTDGGFSGGNTDRPALQAMIRDVQEKRVEKVLVWKLDRLSRSQLDTLYLIEKVFLANNVDFVSMQENFDTSTAFGRAMIGILAVFAQLEREQIKERMMVGKVARSKQGLWHGGGLVPVGYEYRDGKLDVVPYEAMQIREAFDLYLAGTPVRRIETIFWERGYVHKYGKWSGRRLHDVLTNDIYIGNITYQGKTVSGQHEPIVSREIFAAVQERIAATHYSKAHEASRYLLTGFVFCARCGARYGSQIRRTKYGEYRYYACYSRHKVAQRMIRDPNCTNKTWRMEELDAAVLGEISKLALDPSGVAQRIRQADAPDPEAAILAEVRKTDAQISRLLDLYAIGSIDPAQIAEKTKALQNRKAALERQLSEIRAKAKTSPIYAAKLIRTFPDVLAAGNAEQLRSVVLALIERIDIDGESVTIRWNF